MSLLFKSQCKESVLVSEFTLVNLCPASYHIILFLTNLLLLQCGIFKNDDDEKLNEVGSAVLLNTSDTKNF